MHIIALNRQGKELTFRVFFKKKVLNKREGLLNSPNSRKGTP